MIEAPHPPHLLLAQLRLFLDDLPPLAVWLAPRPRAPADQGIDFGTSSWKYEGWPGSIHSPRRYSVRGRLSANRFERECLAEPGSPIGPIPPADRPTCPSITGSRAPPRATASKS